MNRLFYNLQTFTNAIPTLQTTEKGKPICLFSQKSNKRRFAETNKSTTFVGDLENRDYVFLIISLKKRANYDLFTRSGTHVCCKEGS